MRQTGPYGTPLPEPAKLGRSASIQKESRREFGRAHTNRTHREAVPSYKQTPAHQPQLRKSSLTRHHSTHPVVWKATPDDVPLSNAVPAETAAKIKINYHGYVKAGPHNEKPRPSANKHVSEEDDTFTPKQLEKLRANYEAKKASRNGTDSKPPASYQTQASAYTERRRGSSFSRFVNWVKKTLDDKSSKSHPTNDGRPSTAPGHATAQTESQPISRPAPAHKSDPAKVATGIRGSFDDTRLHRQTNRFQAPVLGSNHSSDRDTSGTTWGNFLDQTKKPQQSQQRQVAPAIPPPPAIPRKPLPTASADSNAHITKPAPARHSGHSHASGSTGHSKKPSASNLLTKVTHGGRPRRNSDDSDMSFMCSGVDDPALEVTNGKRAAVIERQKRERATAAAKRPAYAQHQSQIFSTAKTSVMDQQAREEAEARLEARLRDSMYGHPEERPRPKQRRSSSIIDIDLTGYAGAGGFARPPSSIYGDRPLTGYTDPGNPYDRNSVKSTPPVPRVPSEFKTGKNTNDNGEVRDTKFYKDISDTFSLYRSTPPPMPKQR